MADLLLQHGALDNLPQPDRITVLCGGIAGVALPKSAHDWSKFTLLELLAVEYNFLSGSPEYGGGSEFSASAFFYNKACPFPDLAHLRIRRPASDLKSWQEQAADLSPVLASGDCSKDVRLEWGDVVEIPVADHPLNEKWPGFSTTELANLKKCLTRQINIVVNGQVTNLTLAPQISGLDEQKEAANAAGKAGPGIRSAAGGGYGGGGGGAASRGFGGVGGPIIFAQTPFWLKPVLLNSKLVLTSCDLSRVKVTRHDPATGQMHEWVVDCSPASPAPDLWLRDGDKIEVPEKTSAYATQPVRPTATWIGPGPIQLSEQVPPPPVVEDTNPVPPPPPAEQAPSSFQQRLKRIRLVPASQTPQAAEEQYLSIGGVLYSPKTNDSVLLDAGYHRDPSAKTRKAECWEQRAAAPLPGRGGNTIWTGADMIEFGGEGMGTTYDDGARYCFAEDTWATLPKEGAPSSRSGHALVWTGKEMIAWGGFGGVWGNDTLHNDGARYTPATDTWKPMTTRNAPSARIDFSAVWTGREMLVWGGFTDTHSRYQGGHADAHLNTGGRYSPSTDSWKTITTQGAPSKRWLNSIVWTGKEAIIWGGGNATIALNDGGRYNPAKDSWRPLSADGAPSPRMAHFTVWTGKEMIVWGGTTREVDTQAVYFENGARYNPETDTWKPISTIGAPKGRIGTFAVWSGAEMIVWGGVNDTQAAEGSAGFDPSRYIGTGARYNPATDTWTEMTLTGAPSPRVAPNGVWTGDGLLVFGGYNGTHFNETWFYSPSRTLYPYVKQQE